MIAHAYALHKLKLLILTNSYFYAAIAIRSKAVCEEINCRRMGQIYILSGDKTVIFDGLARVYAIGIGKDPNAINLVHCDPTQCDFGKKKSFPIMCVYHFFADISKAKAELNWQPQFSLIDGLKDSYENDYLSKGLNKAEVDLSLDDQIVFQS